MIKTIVTACEYEFDDRGELEVTVCMGMGTVVEGNALMDEGIVK